MFSTASSQKEISQEHLEGGLGGEGKLKKHRLPSLTGDKQRTILADADVPLVWRSCTLHVRLELL